METALMLHSRCKADLPHKLLFLLEQFYDSSVTMGKDSFIALAKAILTKDKEFLEIFEIKSLKDSMKYILNYLKCSEPEVWAPDDENNRFEQKIDCARFFFKSLEVLADVDDHPDIETSKY